MSVTVAVSVVAVLVVIANLAISPPTHPLSCSNEFSFGGAEHFKIVYNGGTPVSNPYWQGNPLARHRLESNNILRCKRLRVATTFMLLFGPSDRMSWLQSLFSKLDELIICLNLPGVFVRPARVELATSVAVPAPVGAAFAFASRSASLYCISPPLPTSAPFSENRPARLLGVGGPGRLSHT
uniref:Uncharacterized protein n=1 Tax=Anopheles culicifacies TaxID=139723 RepID=A0A182M8N7_9DIPT